METKLKIITAIAIPYAFFCAGLYQMAYWLPYNINGFSYLSISDILLSFIQPFLYSSFATLFLYTFNYYITSTIRPHGGGNTEPPSKLKKRLWIALKAFYAILIISYITFADTRTKSELLPFILMPGLFFVVSELLLKYNLMEHEKSRFVALYFFVLLPICAYYTGTKNAYEIYDNRKYDYSVKILENDTLKFLGKASNHYIFTSTNNQDKYFFSTDEVKGLKLSSFKKK